MKRERHALFSFIKCFMWNIDLKEIKIHEK